MEGPGKDSGPRINDGLWDQAASAAPSSTFRASPPAGRPLVGQDPALRDRNRLRPPRAGQFGKMISLPVPLQPCVRCQVPTHSLSDDCNAQSWPAPSTGWFRRAVCSIISNKLFYLNYQVTLMNLTLRQLRAFPRGCPRPVSFHRRRVRRMNSPSRAVSMLVRQPGEGAWAWCCSTAIRRRPADGDRGAHACPLHRTHHGEFAAVEEGATACGCSAAASSSLRYRRLLACFLAAAARRALSAS